MHLEMCKQQELTWKELRMKLKHTQTMLFQELEEMLQKILQAAEAYKKEVVAKAEGEASRFLAIYNEYKNAKTVTQERMYLETMEKVLADIDKIIIDKNCRIWCSSIFATYQNLKKTGDQLK